MDLAGHHIMARAVVPHAARAALLPAGMGFLLSILRLRIAGGAGSAQSVTCCFDHIGWPGGELVLDALIDAVGPLDVLPHRACAVSHDELPLVRAAAFLALDLGTHARTELAALPRVNGDAACGALAEIVTELCAAGLGFAMVHVPAGRVAN